MPPSLPSKWTAIVPFPSLQVNSPCAVPFIPSEQPLHPFLPSKRAVIVPFPSFQVSNTPGREVRVGLVDHRGKTKTKLKNHHKLPNISENPKRQWNFLHCSL